MKCVSRLRFLLRFAPASFLRSAFASLRLFAPASLSFRVRSASASCLPFGSLSAFPLPSFSGFPFPLLSSALASASRVRSASLLPSCFAFALPSGFCPLRFPAPSLCFRFGLSLVLRLCLPFRSDSSLRLPLLSLRLACSAFSLPSLSGLSLPFRSALALLPFALLRFTPLSLCLASLLFSSFFFQFSVSRSLKTIQVQEDLTVIRFVPLTGTLPFGFFFVLSTCSCSQQTSLLAFALASAFIRLYRPGVKLPRFRFACSLERR